MPNIKTFMTSATLALMASTLDAATLTFEIEAEVSHITNNIQADISSGEKIRVAGEFDTEALRNSPFANRLRFKDVSITEISGPVFGGHDDFQVTMMEIRDDEAGIESDLFRLIIDFQNGPDVNDVEYGRVRLSFYIPMAGNTLDVATFFDLEQKIYPELVTTADNRTAVGNGAFRFPVDEGGRNASIRTEVTNLRLAPVPLPASGLMLVTVLGGMGVAVRRRRKS